MPTTDSLMAQIDDCMSKVDKLPSLAEHKRLKKIAGEMRDAIDFMESALMGFGDLTDLPEKWGEPRHRDDVAVTLNVTAAQVYRVCDALSELTRIINDHHYHFGRKS